MIGSRLVSLVKLASGATGRSFSTSTKLSGGGHGHVVPYRENPTAERKWLIIAEACGGFMWWWIFWHCFTDYGHLIGHWYPPCPDKWTDEALGIPPDNADDPE